MNARTTLLAVGLLAALLALPAPAHAAETVHLTLKLDGDLIKGESTQTSLGRGETIECVLFRTGLRTAGPTAPVQGGTITIRKRIDAATPFLVSGLIRRSVAEATFRFYRPNPTGDGTTEQFYTVVGAAGVITAVRQLVPDTNVPASANEPPQEEITFQFRSLTFTYTNGGTTAAWEGKL